MIGLRKKYDVVIVGAGAAGSVFAKQLSEEGLSVLLLEKGKHHNNHNAQFTEDEASVFDLVWDNSQYEVIGNGFTGAPNLGNSVGGGTLAWAGVAFRFFERDFRFLSEYGKPAGSNVADWPISLSDLADDYEQAEKQMGVSGDRVDDSGAQLPNPAFGYYTSGQYLLNGLSNLGLNGQPGPVAINSRFYDDRQECLHCGFCRSGCRVDAKYQADEALLKKVLEKDNFTLLANAAVQKIHTKDHGQRASGVTFVDTKTGSYHYVKCKTLVLANNPMEIPRLLLNSKDEYHQFGLGNNDDQVGRNFFCHATTVATGITDDCISASHGYNMGNIVCLDYTKSHNKDDYVGGFSFQSLNGAGAVVLAVDPLKHMWGAQLKEHLRKYNNSLYSICFCEGLPVYDNRITLSDRSIDEYGLPNAKIIYELHDNDKKLFSKALQVTEQIMLASGAHTVYQSSPPFEAHPMGTMRMGKDPRSSATDEFGRIHGLKNVYVGGAALFVTGSSLNPTLTIHALALRSCKKIKHSKREMHEAD